MDLDATQLAREQVEVVLVALRSLTPEQLDVIVMRYYMDFSAKQTAIVAGVTERAVLARQSRALERLRESLASRGITEGADIL